MALCYIIRYVVQSMLVLFVLPVIMPFDPLIDVTYWQNLKKLMTQLYKVIVSGKKRSDTCLGVPKTFDKAPLFSQYIVTLPSLTSSYWHIL
jgi:hypothetical protein